MDKYLVVQITNIANELDNKGLFDEASLLDDIVKEAYFAISPIGYPSNYSGYKSQRKVERVEKSDKEKTPEKLKSVKSIGLKDRNFQDILEWEIKRER